MRGCNPPPKQSPQVVSFYRLHPGPEIASANPLIVLWPSQSRDPPKPPLKRGASGSLPFRKEGFGGDPLQLLLTTPQETGFLRLAYVLRPRILQETRFLATRDRSISNRRPRGGQGFGVRSSELRISLAQSCGQTIRPMRSDDPTNAVRRSDQCGQTIRPMRGRGVVLHQLVEDLVARTRWQAEPWE